LVEIFEKKIRDENIKVLFCSQSRGRNEGSPRHLHFGSTEWLARV